MRSIPELSSSDLLRFLKKVKKVGDCWIWQGFCYENGYGQFNLSPWEYRAHRVSFRHFSGLDPGPIRVLHECNTPACVNPKHLFLGTQRANVQQSHDEGRHSMKGDLHPRAKLSEAEVKQILELWFTESNKLSEIAKVFPWVSYGTIESICSRRSWAHISLTMSVS
jgi:hypothetical protein